MESDIESKKWTNVRVGSVAIETSSNEFEDEDLLRSEVREEHRPSS